MATKVCIYGIDIRTGKAKTVVDEIHITIPPEDISEWLNYLINMYLIKPITINITYKYSK